MMSCLLINHLFIYFGEKMAESNASKRPIQFGLFLSSNGFQKHNVKLIFIVIVSQCGRRLTGLYIIKFNICHCKGNISIS